MDDLLQYFAYDHLRPPLRAVSMRFYDMAEWLAEELPDGSEKSVALRKLLEAKDAAVRSTAVDGKDE